MKASRQRTKATTPYRSIVISYLVMVAILLAFLGLLYLIVVFEYLFII